MTRILAFVGGVLLVILGVVAVLLPVSSEIDGVYEVAAGHTALESDDLGAALYHYKRALAVIPRDSAAQLGAAVVRALRTDILPKEAELWADITNLTADVMSVNELRWLSLILWTGTFIFGGWWAINRPDPRLRRTTLILGSLTIVLLGLLIVRRVYEETQPASVVTAFEAFAYAAPDENAPILFKLYSAAEGRILERREGWARLHLPDGREGWVQERVMSSESRVLR